MAEAVFRGVCDRLPSKATYASSDLCSMEIRSRSNHGAFDTREKIPARCEPRRIRAYRTPGRGGKIVAQCIRQALMRKRPK